MNNLIYTIFIWSVIFVSVSRGGDSIYATHKRQVSEKGEKMSGFINHRITINILFSFIQ